MKGTIDWKKSKFYYIKCFEYACVKNYERNRALFFHAHKKLILIVRTYTAGYMQNIVYTVHCDASLTYLPIGYFTWYVFASSSASSCCIHTPLFRLVPCMSGTREALERIYQCMQFLFNLLGTCVKIHACTLHACFKLESSGTVAIKHNINLM